MWKRLLNNVWRVCIRVLVVLAPIFGTYAKEPPKAEHFSHEIFDSLLQANVHGGLINYDAFNTPAFTLYCGRLGTASPDEWDASERLAFWLNAHNALVVKSALNRPGMKMINNFADFFTTDTLLIAGKLWTLKALRDYIPKKYSTPLIYFGAMLPALGAPRPPSRAFRAKNVVAELEKIARLYFRSESGCVLDIAAKTLRLSWICSEYRQDFEHGGKSLLASVLPYLDDKTAAFAAVYKDQIAIDFLPFDWRINARRSNNSDFEAKPYFLRKDTAAIKAKSLKRK